MIYRGYAIERQGWGWCFYDIRSDGDPDDGTPQGSTMTLQQAKDAVDEAIEEMTPECPKCTDPVERTVGGLYACSGCSRTWIEDDLEDARQGLPVALMEQKEYRAPKLTSDPRRTR